MSHFLTLGRRVRPAPHRLALITASLWGIRRAMQDRRGAVAVEFALVSWMLISSILLIMFVGLVLYIDQALDYATTKAARQIMTGFVQKNGITQSAFRTQILCSYLPASMNCSDVIVNVQTLTEAAQPGGYYNFVKTDQSGLIIPSLSNGAAQYNVGIQTSYVYLQVIYPVTFLPSFLGKLIGGGAAYNGSPAYLAVSTAAFRNEQY